MCRQIGIQMRAKHWNSPVMFPVVLLQVFFRLATGKVYMAENLVNRSTTALILLGFVSFTGPASAPATPSDGVGCTMMGDAFLCLGEGVVELVNKRFTIIYLL